MVPSYFVFANFHFRYLSEQFSKIECQDNLCNVPLQPGFISPTQQQGPGTRESQETLLFPLQPKLILIFMKLIRDLCGRPQEIF